MLRRHHAIYHNLCASEIAERLGTLPASLLMLLHMAVVPLSLQFVYATGRRALRDMMFRPCFHRRCRSRLCFATVYPSQPSSLLTYFHTDHLAVFGTVTFFVLDASFKLNPVAQRYYRSLPSNGTILFFVAQNAQENAMLIHSCLLLPIWQK